ncbi:hypothetical protein RZP94_22645 [Citrobacter freundii]|uniref:hypothetical protein n=1 Tax=Citrobacter freundii TaxID=546 RepID=UPI00138A8403|nr:hypothetical protein [Citrobacter freundii]EBS1368537.1 hypothetical protein [Salmonella enterica subsp. enterica serovar Virchow]MDV1144760.1 hypothetical protein [Citrobacter freundii]MDV1165012.1 hypothetical protein [Citrobacter freundii]MDV1170148.1 hypothetical protein [Citrobacter freundii]MEB0450259.1 hypothetical protein [Citrobacter freundii]
MTDTSVNYPFHNYEDFSNDGQQGIGGKSGLGSTTEKMQGRVAEAIFANCADLNDSQLDEIINWVRLYKTQS